MLREALMKQIELDLWVTLKQAAELPELAELSNLWTALDTELSQLNTLDQLRIAGEAICQITDIVVERSFLTLEEIESIYQDSGPVVEADFFDKFVRQSMSVDFAQFVEAPAPLPRIPNLDGKQKFPNDGRSVVVAIDKNDLLNALESKPEPSVEVNPDDILAIAHSEDIPAFCSALAQWMTKKCGSEAVSLKQIQQGLGIPLVAVWLGILLGGQEKYRCEQHGEFYDYPDTIFVFNRR